MWLSVSLLSILAIKILQILLVWIYCSMFFLGQGVGSVLLMTLLASPLYLAALAYLIMSFFFDIKTPQQGGRRFQWFRYLKLWHLIRDYFPIKLIRTKRLDAKRNYVLGYHPHGIMCVGAWLNFATEATGFSTLFPGITPYLMTLKSKYSYWIELLKEGGKERRREGGKEGRKEEQKKIERKERKEDRKRKER